MEITVTGTEELRAAAKRAREAQASMQRKLRDAVLEAVDPFNERVRESIHQVMPSRYAAVLDSAFRMLPNATDTGVRIKGFAQGRRSERDVASLDRGRLRHPLWGDRERWYSQAVRPGFWTKSARKMARPLEKALRDVLDRIAKQIGE